MSKLRSGIAGRIALVAFASAAVAMAIVAAGVLVVGAEAFTTLMVEAGESAAHAHEMYDTSVGRILLVAVLIASLASVALALLLSSVLAKPLDELGTAARRIANGDYAARVLREGPEEILTLADSFNQMAEALDDQERLRRDFIANASHELRTPLTNLQGYLEALRDGVLTAETATYQSLWEEADRLVRLARSLDGLAEGDRTGSSHVRNLDLAPILSAAVELVSPALESRNVRVERRWPAVLRAKGDPDHLAQVLGNLLQNAARYTPDGGEVTVAAEIRPHSVLVSVSNTGEPIPEQELGNVFERFYRLEKSRDPARGGAGIGLAIVKQLVEASGGTVGAESSGGHNRFWFTLRAS